MIHIVFIINIQLKFPHRDEVHKMLGENGIGAMLYYYPIPLHFQKLMPG